MRRGTGTLAAVIGLGVGCLMATVGCSPYRRLDRMLCEHHMTRMVIPGTREPGALVEIIDGADYLIGEPTGVWRDWTPHG